jgi:hypothetical protein
MFGKPPYLTSPPRDSVHRRRYHPVDCVESNLPSSVVCPLSKGFPQVFNLELEAKPSSTAQRRLRRPQADEIARQSRPDLTAADRGRAARRYSLATKGMRNPIHMPLPKMS